MQLPVQSQSTLYCEPWEPAAGAAELMTVAQAADEGGAFYVAVCDHVAIPRELAPKMGTTWYDTWTTLGFLAAGTTQTRLLSHVSVPAYRHPLVTAKAVCTLDRLSGGRAILGVGAGHVQGEFEALGVDFSRRGPLLDEALDVLLLALEEEFPDAGGRLGVAGRVGVAPRPVQVPRPPVWIGGSSAAAVRRAARVGDGLLPQGTPRADMPALVAALTAAAAGLRDDPLDVGAITEWLYVGTPGWDVGRPVVAGPAEELAESLRAYAAMGVSHLQVRFPSRSVDELVDQITAFGSQVAPLLKQ
jgi:probable F420-dependent oxidoreductase